MAPGANRLMFDSDVVFYAGLLGRPRTRVLGAWTLYAPASGRLQISVGGEAPMDTAACVVPPYVPHSLRTADQRIQCVLVEPDFIDVACLTPMLTLGKLRSGDHGWGERMALLAAEVPPDDAQAPHGGNSLEMALFGATLPRRCIDPRIARVIERIRRDPSDLLSADDCAAACGLSASRFIHLFKGECHTTFRGFRTWKRARSLLNAVDSGATLTQIAMDLGYSDSAYFSNSIRYFTGLRPRDILAGSRALVVDRR
ncbi:MAG TPA: AraC family transcriptional regulator [Candidatus Aquabacterium excrementipullorum]|nr:AraC family transcriptional regulator [Candidatus Aquabacterium excrementipullorum]